MRWTIEAMDDRGDGRGWDDRGDGRGWGAIIMSGIMDADGTTGTDGAQGAQGSQGRAKRQRAVTVRPAPRRVDPSAPGAELWGACMGELWPWRYREYPGWRACAAAALGLSSNTVARWCRAGTYAGVTAPAARRLSALLKSRASTAMHLAAELDKYADDRDAAATKNARYNLRIMRIEERDGWRSRPRKLKP